MKILGVCAIQPDDSSDFPWGHTDHSGFGTGDLHVILYWTREWWLDMVGR